MISTLQSRAMVVMLCVAACVAAWLGFAAGCEKKSGAAAAGPAGAKVLRVVTTTAHMAELVRMAAGDLVGKTVTVESIMGEGIDPHTYKLTRSDAALLDGADMVIASGLHLEGKMDDTLSALKSGNRRVVDVGESLPVSRVMYANGAHDPHYWMDVELMGKALKLISEELARRTSVFAGQDPDAEFVRGVVKAVVPGATPPESKALMLEAAAKKRAAAEAKLGELLAYARRSVETIPAEQRVLVTSHDAFAYLGRSVGLEVHAIQGISTESEASVRDIESLAQMLAEKKVPAVFVESSVPRRTIDALIAATRARGHEVKIGGELFSDALGKPGTYEGTYIGMMDHNITTIVRGLGGTVPERGMSGKLAVPASR